MSRSSPRRNAWASGVYRGSEDDVLRRFADAAREFELDVVVRVTSDCPLIDGAVVREGVERFIALDDQRAHVSNVIERTYPRGFDFEVFSAPLLFEADEQATSRAEREHVTPYLYANPASRTTLHAIRRDDDASNYRVTLDTSDDLELIRRLIEQHDAAHLNVDEIVDRARAAPGARPTQRARRAEEARRVARPLARRAPPSRRRCY